MKILFRVDSSSLIGTGHTMRCLVLAKQLLKKYPHAKIVFATLPLQGNLDHIIKEAGYQHIQLTSDAKEELISLIKTWHVELLVIDHYGVDAAFERAIKEQTGVTIMVLDDTYQPHHCDILLNHNISAKARRYKRLIPQGALLECGKEFSLLKEEFYELKNKKSKKKRTQKRLLIALGGTDIKQENLKLVKLLQKYKKLKIDLVTTTANKKIKALENSLKRYKNIRLHRNTPHMPKLMHQADCAIVTPSVSANEALFMKLPYIALQSAKNQHYNCEYLRAQRIACFKKITPKRFLASFKRLLKR